MEKKTKYMIYGAFLSGMLLISVFCSAQSSNFRLSLRDQQSESAPGTASSNVIGIANNTNSAHNLQLSISTPAGWKIMGSDQRNFRLAPGDSIFFPLNVVIPIGISNAEPQSVNIFLSLNGRVILSRSWFVKPKLKSSWSATFYPDRIYIMPKSDTASFSIQLRNEGDLTEELFININPDMGLSLLDPALNLKPSTSFKIFLQAGKDTTFRTTIQIPPTNFTQDPFAVNANRESFYCRVSIKNNALAGVSRLWNGRIEIRKTHTEIKAAPSSREVIPLSMEWNAYDMLSEQSFGSLSLSGFKTFDNQHSLNYFIQSSFSSNYLNPKSFLGEYYLVSYQAPQFGAEAGNTGISFNGANLSGQGVKAWGEYANHRLTTAFIQSPSVFKDKLQQGFSGEYAYLGSKITTKAFFLNKENYFQKTSSNAYALQAHTNIIPHHHLSLGADFSQESHKAIPDSNFTRQGLGYKAILSGSFPTISYTISFLSSSPEHLMHRGTTSFRSSANYRIKKNQSVGFNIQHLDYKPIMYYRGVLVSQILNMKRQSAQLRYIYNSSFASYIIAPTHYNQSGEYLTSNTTGLEMEFRQKGNTTLRFGSAIFAGYSSLPLSNLDPFFVAQWRTNLRYDAFSLNFRYYYGPFHNSDLKLFSENQKNINRLFLNVFYDKWMYKNKLWTSVGTSFNYATRNNQYSISVRPELTYSPLPDLKFGLYMRYFLFGSQSDVAQLGNDINPEAAVFTSGRFEMGFSIKKDLAIPVSGKKYFDMEILVYADASASGDYRAGDPVFENVLVRVQKITEPLTDNTAIYTPSKFAEAMTNAKGLAKFENFEPGVYMVSIIPTTFASQAFQGKSFDINLTSSQLFALSIDRGARVSGAIILQRDRYSQFQHVPLSGIRITATNSNGNSFSTLSDAEGRYNLFLAQGSYTLSVNENAFGESFKIAQNNLPFEIRNNKEIITLNFFVEEKSRAIRIQTPNNGKNGNNNQPDKKPDENQE